MARRIRSNGKKHMASGRKRKISGHCDDRLKTLPSSSDPIPCDMWHDKTACCKGRRKDRVKGTARRKGKVKGALTYSSPNMARLFLWTQHCPNLARQLRIKKLQPQISLLRSQNNNNNNPVYPMGVRKKEIQQWGTKRLRQKLRRPIT
jgi:hypothetical protein